MVKTLVENIMETLRKANNYIKTIFKSGKNNAVRFYRFFLVLALLEMTGCGRTIRKFTAMGDYGVEKFIRGKPGALLYVCCAVAGAIMLFVTNRSRSTEEMARRKKIGAVLLFIGIVIMLIRHYLAFYYVGRQTPY